VAIGALGTDTLAGRRRWPVSRRPVDIVVLAILGLSVASAIIAVVTGVGVLLGVLSALPIATLVLQLILFVIMIIAWVMRP